MNESDLRQMIEDIIADFSTVWFNTPNDYGVDPAKAPEYIIKELKKEGLIP